MLEPDDGKLSRPVLRGSGLSNGVQLLLSLALLGRNSAYNEAIFVGSGLPANRGIKTAQR